MAKSGIKLGLVDLGSDVPPVVASSGQEWSYIGSSSPEFRCTPHLRHLVAKSGTQLGPVDLSSFAIRWSLVFKSTSSVCKRP